MITDVIIVCVKTKDVSNKIRRNAGDELSVVTYCRTLIQEMTTASAYSHWSYQLDRLYRPKHPEFSHLPFIRYKNVLYYDYVLSYYYLY